MTRADRIEAAARAVVRNSNIPSSVYVSVLVVPNKYLNALCAALALPAEDGDEMARLRAELATLREAARLLARGTA